MFSSEKQHEPPPPRKRDGKPLDTGNGAARATPDVLTATIDEFLRVSGLSRPTVYRMLKRGDLQSITVGVRRLIVMASYRELIARQLAGEA